MENRMQDTWRRFVFGLLAGLVPVLLVVLVSIAVTWFPAYRMERRFFDSLDLLHTWNVQRGAEWLMFWSMLVFSMLVMLLAMLPGLILLLRQQFFVYYSRIIGLGIGILTGFISLGFALSARGWSHDYLLWRNSVDSGPKDPVFSHSAGFYLTELPFRSDIVSGVRGVLIVALILGVATWAGAHLTDRALIIYRTGQSGRWNQPGASWSEESWQAITALGSGFWMLIALYLGIYQVITTFFIWWYERPNLVFKAEDIIAGPGARATTIDIPGQYIIIGAHLVMALFLIGIAVTRRSRPRFIIGALALPLIIVVAIQAVGGFYQYFSIRPNELAKQEAYISRTIEGTRAGYGLDRIEQKSFDEAPTGVVQSDLDANQQTIDKIRVADPDALLRAIEQLQEVRTFYGMHEPDVDRYVINGELTQVLLSARELTPDQLPPEISGNFVQRRLQFTHGYGVVVAPARWSTSSESGEPQLLVENIPVAEVAGFPEITQPRLYISENIPDNDWVMVNTGIDEFDYPGTQDVDAENRYDGPDGFAIGGGFSRALAVLHLNSFKLWTSEYINNDSRILLHRNPLDRLKTIAPMFAWDSDPLLVIRDDGSLAYVANGIVTSDNYPYSSLNFGDNYRRNTIKAVVDAYTGKVTLYVVDNDDPITQAYQHAMPELFTTDPLPADIVRHLQYPTSLFSWQAQGFQIYHATDATTVYRGTDLWTVDSEQVYNWNTGKNMERPMEPYWVLSGIPSDPELAYRSILGFSVQGKQPLAGWMTVNNDTSEITAFLLPRGSQTMGSLQFESLLNSNPDISGQLSLWNQQGSSVVQGRTVITPIADGFLYIEPIYLVGEGSRIPQLVRVVAGTQDRVAWGNNLEAALAEMVRAPITPGADGGGEQPPPAGTPTPGTPQPPPTLSPIPGGPTATPGGAELPADLTTLSDADLAGLADQLYTAAQSAPDFEARGQALDDLGRVLEEIIRRNQ